MARGHRRQRTRPSRLLPGVAWPIVVLTIAAGACSAPQAEPPKPSNPTAAPAPSPALTLKASRGSGHWARYSVDGGGAAIDVYLAHEARPKPLVILIQGSGCAPVMTVEPDGTLEDTSLFQDLIPGRLEQLHFAIVEKRGIEPLRFTAGMTRQQKLEAFERAGRSCSAEYLQNATKPSRVGAIVSTFRALRREAWVRDILLAGHSEGTHVATGVLQVLKGSEISAAGLFASAGPIPFYGGYVAQGGGPDRLRQTLDQIRMLQHADENVIYEGLPVRRWKTFWLDSTPIEDVRDSPVPLFVAQGTRDGSALPADLFALEAIRQQPNRPLRYVVVEGADHGFETRNGQSKLAALFDDFTRWSLDANRQTGVAVLK